MPRPSNTEQRRHEIVQSLLTVMADQGYAKATIQAIAKQATMRPGLIHYHFESKQEILVELVKWVSERTQERYRGLAKEAATPREKLKAFIDAHLARGAGEIPEAVAAWVVIGTEAIRQPEVKALYEEVIGNQQSVLKELLKQSSEVKLSSKQATELASIVIAAMEGAYQLSVAADGVMPKNYAASNLMKLIENAIFTTKNTM